jgi:inorganic pyrophosphatase
MIPQTLLSEELGGDGDPLDVLVLGPPVERGKVLKCKVIGLIYLNDKGERDDKIIAVSSNSPLNEINNLEELNEHYHGISEIIEIWFSNYKGPEKMECLGFGEQQKAMDLVHAARKMYQNNN